MVVKSQKVIMAILVTYVCYDKAGTKLTQDEFTKNEPYIQYIQGIWNRKIVDCNARCIASVENPVCQEMTRALDGISYVFGREDNPLGTGRCLIFPIFDEICLPFVFFFFFNIFLIFF